MWILIEKQNTKTVYVVAFYINILQLYLEIIKLSVIIEYSTIKKWYMCIRSIF